MVSGMTSESARVDASTLERKSIPIVAWYMLSNESYMNRVIREVLPTVPFWSAQDTRVHTWALFENLDVPLCSPKKTNLYAERGWLALEILATRAHTIVRVVRT